MATGSGITIHIEGLDKLRGKLNDRRADVPVRRFLDRGAIYMQTRARAKVSVDTGRTRNSIAVSSPTDRMRHIGPNVFWGPFIEFGTRPHWPPVGALAGWAHRHGTSDYAVRRKIGMFGTKPKPFLAPAAEETEGFIRTIVPVLAGEIESAYAKD